MCLIGQNNVGQNVRHLDKFCHLFPVKQPEDASFLGQNFRQNNFCRINIRHLMLHYLMFELDKRAGVA